ncbi:MAG TPA: glycosyltransferase family 1 protein [Candidatus Saccharimonadales bacterium]
MAHIVIDGRIISSGTGNYIKQLITHLEQLNSPHEFTVLVRASDEHYWQPTKKNFNVRVADFADYSFSEQLAFKRFLDELQPDLVHFCMPQQPVLYKGKTVTTIHDLILIRITETDDMNAFVFHIKQNVFRWLLRKVAHKSTHIITPSEFTKQDLIDFSGIPHEKVTVTHEAAGILLDKEQPIKIFENKRFIMYQGRAEPYKNNRGLIKAHQQLLQKFPDLELVVVGKKDAFRTADELWAFEQGYKNITFTGFVSDAQSTWLYRHCEAYVCPSFMEGFGFPALEAMTAGAAVVSSDATSLPEVCGDAALYFDAHNTEDMASKIEKVLTDDSLKKSLRKKGPLRAKQFSWRRMAEQTLAVYNQAL